MKAVRFCLLIAITVIWCACGSGGNENSKTEATVQPEAPPPPDTSKPAAPANQDASPTAEQSDPVVRLVRLTLGDQLKADLDKGLIDSASRVFKYTEYDLNGDNKKEIFVGLTGPYFCGSGGCTMYLLDNQGKVITLFSVTNYPVIVSDSKTKGWRDLIIESGGNHLVRFNGTKYPSNPSTQPKYGQTPGDGLPRMLVWDNTPSFQF